MSLSDKRVKLKHLDESDGNLCLYLQSDVREFIKKIKERLPKGIGKNCEIFDVHKIIDEESGDKLI